MTNVPVYVDCMHTMEAKVILIFLRMRQREQGMAFCDKCGDALYEEALRCDFCCGKFGEPPQEAVQVWLKLHPGYFEKFGSGREEEYANEEEV
jgi:cephalosporin hydroxylase